MAKSNAIKVGEALDILNQGLLPFVKRELQAVHKDKWEAVAAESLTDNRGAVRGKKKTGINWDTSNLIGIMLDQWNVVFNKTLSQSERSLVHELREVRNQWAHQTPFSTDDAYRALDSMERLLDAVSAPEESKLIAAEKIVILRTKFDKQLNSQTRKNAVTSLEGAPQSGLKPWREVVTPHPDVASGNYQQAEFAADLWQVYLGEATSEYQNPAEFFRRTFITEGLRKLLVNGIRRLGGKGGDPVIELQTNFGGGKTHSMLALFHLFSGTNAAELPGCDVILSDVILKEAEVSLPSKVKRAVLVGTKISPGSPSKKKDGSVVHTLWGEIAWQLGGKAGYEMVRVDDEKGTNPGDKMRELFNKFSPCLILIDEWVAYARLLREDATLSAGTFDTQFTFAQTLSESAKGASNTLLIVSIPESENEVGGERGKHALDCLKNAMGRVEASWSPASVDEGFEIVRRRLFEPLPDQQQAFIARDTVARAFVDMYGAQRNEFPPECREADYESRIKLAYPIHPELFDRLYKGWSTLDRFQRTRGVLRLMAAVIHSLWRNQDNSLLIMPASVPIGDPDITTKLMDYLDDPWRPVMSQDVDGENSTPQKLDGETPNLGRYSACRRVARTIYIGSAPTTLAANKGIDDREVKLGCVQPGEAVATFGDAIRRLTDTATYLYVDGNRYWYSTQPTVARTADGRAAQCSDDAVFDELLKRLRKAGDTPKDRGDFARIHIASKSNDIPDEREVRLVILGPEHTHSKGQQESAALAEARNILEFRGNSPRSYKNSLVFLAADKARLDDLTAAIRMYLAWQSICTDKETLNLDPFQTKQAKTKCDTADDTVKSRIPETFQWVLVPNQPDPKGAICWDEIRLQRTDAMIQSVSRRLNNDEMLLTNMGGARLRLELDRIPLWRGDSVSLKQLIDDFAKYSYLPRLSNPQDVLMKAVQDGVKLLTWQSDSFTCAQSQDAKGRFVALVCGGTAASLPGGTDILLVKPDVAIEQQKREAEAAKAKVSTDSMPATTAERTARDSDSAIGTPPTGNTTGTGVSQPSTTAAYRRFHGSVPLDHLRVGRDAGRIADEVIRHLSKLVGAEVTVTLEIQAELPEGTLTEKIIRDVTENCRTLHFDTFGFEED